METKIPANMLNELRQILASSISDFKAYDMPGVCKRLGMIEGTEEEAFKSKYTYASRRLVSLNAVELLSAAKQLVDETEAHALGEIVEKISDLGKGEVTKLTRRKLMKLFDDQLLVSEVEEYEFIKSLWPIAEMPSPDKQDPRTLEEYLIQHTIRNDDLTQQDILDSLGLLSCSTAQLFRFLEEITSAEFQSFERQTLLSGKIDALLQHDNYTLSLKAAKFPDIRFSKWFH